MSVLVEDVAITLVVLTAIVSFAPVVKVPVEVIPVLQIGADVKDLAKGNVQVPAERVQEPTSIGGIAWKFEPFTQSESRLLLRSAWGVTAPIGHVPNPP